MERTIAQFPKKKYCARTYTDTKNEHKKLRQILFIVRAGVAKTQKINSSLCTKIKTHTQPSQAC